MVHLPGVSAPLPWERQYADTDASWEAFRKFRDTKTPRRLIMQRGTATAQIYKWYKDLAWDSRVRAYDAHVERILLEERDQLLRQHASEIAAEHMAMLQTARDITQRELDKLLRKVGEDDEYSHLKPVEITKLMEAVIKYDRLIRGETTENTEHKIDLSSLSLEEVRMYERLKEKVYGSSTTGQNAPNHQESDPVPALRGRGDI